MGYINKVLERSSLQSLGEYLLYGVESPNAHSAKSYEVRLNKAHENWNKVITEYLAKEQISKIEPAFSEILSENECVYIELGIQSGFRLAKEIEQRGEDDMKYKEMYTSLFQDVTNTIRDLQTAQNTVEEMYLSFGELKEDKLL